jgi:hypothetical protein
MPRLWTNRPGSRLWTCRIRLANRPRRGSRNSHPHDQLHPISHRLSLLWRKVAGFFSQRNITGRKALPGMEGLQRSDHAPTRS